MSEIPKNRLMEYIKEGNMSKVKYILIEDPSLIDAETFFAVAELGNFEMLKYLVEYSRISLNEYSNEHENVLHFAARSGNLMLFRYLVEKCGMDPLEGDINLITPWDIIRRHLSSDGKTENSADKSETEKEPFRQIDEYLTKRYGHPFEDFYRNPVRSGFFPDPSICRVGEDYYMVNSSFIFFPCIPISHSRDLIHWEIIGHAITNPEWAYLDELEGGRGYWAPDISYYEGMFYITATYRLNDRPPIYRRQMVVKSLRPEGPYSKPVFIDEDGIDPSIFNDDNGKRYMLLNRGARIFALDKSGTKKISDAQLLYYGNYKRAPEGPHLFKKDGYYYLLEAEGGTGPGHRVTISRSKELFGNYEPCPYNPIMRQCDEDAAIQRCGHGDMVETSDGRWYMVYLCGRMIDGSYSILGRETAIDPVTWTADGWPIVNSLKGPSCLQVKPFPEMSVEIFSQGSGQMAFVPGNMVSSKPSKERETLDALSPCGLFMDYMTPRPFEEGAVRCSVSGSGNKKERHFVIRGSKFPLSDVHSRNIVLRRQTSFKFEYSASLEIPKKGGITATYGSTPSKDESFHNMKEGQCAGITGYYDENTFFEFGVLCKDNYLYIYAKEHVGDSDRLTISDEALDLSVNEIRLIMRTDYLKRELSYALSEEGGEIPFTTLHNVNYLCDEGLIKGKRFTGALVGMYAFRGALDLSVSFRNDIYNDLEEC